MELRAIRGDAMKRKPFVSGIMTLAMVAVLLLPCQEKAQNPRDTGVSVNRDDARDTKDIRQDRAAIEKGGATIRTDFRQRRADERELRKDRGELRAESLHLIVLGRVGAEASRGGFRK
jgi:hypothetical protein